MITLKHHQKINIPFAMSWWAFTFPLGSFIVATGVVHKAIGGDFFVWVGMIAFISFLVIWVTVFVRTLKDVVSGEIFKG